MASAKTAASVLSVSAGRLAFWRRVKIFGEAGLGPLLWMWRSSRYPLPFLPVKGAFTGIALRDDVLISAGNPDHSMLTETPQLK